MSVGFEVHGPADLRGKNCFFISGDPVQPKVFAAIGGIMPKELTINEILPGLTSGSINVLTASPLGAEQLRWASRITHVSSQTTAFAIGATVVSSSRLRELPRS
jgi:TRAP-type C4-dicarboxylate transport system substrate-binding protein